MKNKKRLNIGFFTCHLDNDYAYEICKGVDYAANELDVNLIVFPGMYMNASYNDPQNARFDYQYNSIFYYASKHTLDALIVSIGSIGSFLSENDMIKFLENFDVPILTLEIEVPGYPVLYTESKTGMRQVIEHLIKEHGKTKIGFVSGRKENADAQERLKVYCDVLKENGIEIDENKIVYGNFSEFTEDIVNDLLDRNPDLEAIAFANDQMAIGGYTAIKARGLEIGKDILVTGYDDSAASIILEPPLTTVHNSAITMGYKSVYEAVNLVNTGKTELSTLNSKIIERASCGCDYHNEDNISDIKNVFSSSLEDAVGKIDELLYDGYTNAFYYDKLINTLNPFFEMILSPIVDGSFDYDIKKITDFAYKLPESYVINGLFNYDKTIYSLSRLRDMLLLVLQDNPEHVVKISTLFNSILETLLFHTSSDLFNVIRINKSDSWTSMYITRDAITYSTDEEACFKLIMDKLYGDFEFKSSYIYIYDEQEPVRLLPDASWKVPDTLYLQVCNDSGKTTYLTGDTRIISSSDVFFNNYTPYNRRRTMVVTPLFTTNVQYGLFVGEVDITHFNHIYSTSLQLSTSLNFLSLMKKQISIQKKLAISATELNKKNKLLNELSITDPLTGINNRRGFLDSVQELVNADESENMEAMIVFADMDNLKQVNDKFGHNNGDFAIKSIANILRASFSDDDIIGRIGGDEFVAFAFLDDLDRKDEIISSIKEYSKELNDSCGKPYYIDISLGVYTFTCSQMLSIEEVLHHADEALYEQKKNKRKSVVKGAL
ncbi:MAG: GGDEF domain-containing protein [Lachnospiraceae bacterium]|nr:GGDEF domain-containing protein [Lachnospiraceae bacterium]MBQ9608313.1 GGDEF domain-containing protein [Lachnospiraceae bacterium]